MIIKINKRFELIGFLFIYCCFITVAYGQGQTEHFQSVANTGIHRPVQVDTAWITINGFDFPLDSADEIGVFDGELCVGAVKLEPNPQIGNFLFPATFA